MPRVEVRVFCDSDKKSQFLDWYRELEDQDKRAFAKCNALILRLESLGNELRRPIADILRDGIWELRIRTGHVNRRVLYGFCGPKVVVLLGGLEKTRKVPTAAIEKAASNLRLVIRDVNRFTLELNDER